MENKKKTPQVQIRHRFNDDDEWMMGEPLPAIRMALDAMGETLEWVPGDELPALAGALRLLAAKAELQARRLGAWKPEST